MVFGVGMSRKTDKDGQPAFGIHFHNNQEKALRELLGFSQGLVADNAVNELEAAMLDGWLRSNEIWLKADPDYFDLLDVTTDILEDGIVTPDELIDLKEMLYTVLEYRDGDGFSCADEVITRLTGIARGITADEVLNDKEIHHLKGWLNRCGEWRDQWPINVVADKVHEVLKDGVVTREERDHLYSVLVDLMGGHVSEHGETAGTSTRLGVERVECVEFEDKVFCFTGKFIAGTRQACEQLTIEKGASTHPGITKKINYLVVGGLSSRDWANTSFGRKIEKAIELKEKGLSIRIIDEESWVKCLS